MKRPLPPTRRPINGPSVTPMFTKLRLVIVVLAWSAIPALALIATATARAQQQEQAVLAGAQYLRNAYAGKQVGETAMIALGLLKADVPASDPAVVACLAKIRTRFVSGGYNPERMSGYDVYEAAVVALALANLDSSDRGSLLDAVAAHLMRKQKANGSWDYDPRPHGDTSISQYAILGLWECANTGVEIPPSVWDRAAQWYMSTQSSAGSWNYHRDEGDPETISMTAAGVGSLLICRRQLQEYRSFQKELNPYLAPVQDSGPKGDYRPTATPASIDAAVARGMAWIGPRFNTADVRIFGKSIFYGLYGIERIGALADRQAIGRVDWFEKGGAFIRSSQRPDGSWAFSPYSDDVTSVWAILFLTRSTKKSIQRADVRKLGAGTLLGGRYLPSDLTTMTVAGGRIISRPMNGAVEGMLDVLEDPRIENADTAVAGILDRYQKQGPAAIKPHKDRFRRMLRSRDPGLRAVAAWALGRAGDLDAAPDLIAALEDADERVVATARQSLQLIGRWIDGPGPDPGATAEQKRVAAAAWKAWYEAVRPLDPSASDAATAAGPGRAEP
ncbi:HEAT repeat domain-containing protein [Planctomyces sp. SH-PL62]|uniref:HEAT repeat domain-containing protein n=1 Tax=Planctomyces sp. SH-PL62 TaxID=1636152 RepID=UPI00078B3F1C|nr:HEAT repeat domain-containing protein [Planctomyces sp. SH-PL62]AMV39287.1 hypothetical protein VT85_17750 [Planctomyces sp. SH-PL62]